MPLWKNYLWDEINSRNLLLSNPLKVREPRDLRQAESVGLDPDKTFHASLQKQWLAHPAGSRVLLDANHIAIEEIELRLDGRKASAPFKCSS